MEANNTNNLKNIVLYTEFLTVHQKHWMIHLTMRCLWHVSTDPCDLWLLETGPNPRGAEWTRHIGPCHQKVPMQTKSSN